MLIKSHSLGRLAFAELLISAGFLSLTLLGCGGGADVAQTDAAPVALAHFHAAPLQAGVQQVTASWVGTGIGTTLSPTDLRSHYNMPSSLTGEGQTIVIVDAPGSGNIANDLNTFSTYYRLPLCNPANTCFQKIDLSNGRTVSRTNDWAIEIALDVEWAHAVAPAAKIVLVIAAGSSMTDMFNAVKTAAAQPNVAAVSMSWGANEYSSETSSAFDGLFASYPGIVFLASSGDVGDNGSSQSYPAASPYVTAVGGTSIKSLALTSNSSEVAWSLSGGGASIYEAMPLYQTSYLSGTNLLTLNKGKRAIPDVSYNADNANSPVGVYTNGYWYAVGGTSAGAPQWAGITALFAQYLNNKGMLLSTLVRGNSGFNNMIYQVKFQQATMTSF